MRVLPLVLFLSIGYLGNSHAQRSIQFEKVRLDWEWQRIKLVHGIQDRHGLIWAASEEDGLFDFSGTKSNIYRQQSADSAGMLSYHLMNYIFEGSDGNIWASGDGGLVCYKRRENKIDLHPIGSKNGGKLLCKAIEVSQSKIIAIAENYGVIDYNLKERKWADVKSSVPIAKSLSGIIKCKNGSIYLANNRHLLRFNLKTDAFEPHSLISLPFDPAPGRELFHNGIYEDALGNLWLSIVDFGVIVVNPEKKETIRFFDLRSLMIYSDNRKTKEPIIFNGLLYLPTGNIGLFCIDTASEKIASVTFMDLNSRGVGEESVIASKRVFNLFPDRSGSLWACTSAGLFKYTPTKLRIQKFFRVANSPILEANYNNILSFHEAEDGKLWISTMSGALYTWTGSDREFVDLAGTEGSLFPSKKVFKVIGTQGGKFLLSDSCVLFLKDGSKQLETKALSTQLRGLSRKYLDMLSLDNHRYLIASQHGLLVWDQKTDKVSLHNTVNDEKDRIPHLKSFHKDKKGRFWAASMLGGLLYIDTTDFSMTMALGKGNYRSLEEHPKVMSILEHKGYFWLSTWGDGLLKVKIPDEYPVDGQVIIERFETLSNPEINSKVVYGVIPDTKDNLWASTNKGIFSYNHQTQKLKILGPADGLQGYEFNMNAFYKLKNGSFLFGGLTGFNMFNPDDSEPNLFQSKPVIYELTIWNTGSEGENITSKISLIDKGEVALNHNENNLKVEFFYPDYFSPEDNQFRYKLSGINTEWVNLGSNNHLILTSLRPGEYELELSACNSDGLWSKQSAKVKFYISQPIWQNPSLYSFIVVLCLGLAVALVRYRNQRSKKYRAKLNDEVERQTQEITEINKKLATQNQQLDKLFKEIEAENKSKDIIFSILSHDLRSPLTTLKGLLSVIELPGETISPDDLKKYLKQMEQSVDGSLQLIDTILYWYHSQTGSIKPLKKPVSLDQILEAVVTMYQPVAQKKHISFDLQNTTHTIVADEDMLSVIIRNLVSNAIKFSPKGSVIHIPIEKVDNEIWLRIIDQGEGIEEEVINQINSRGQVVSKKGTMHEKGTGLGLALVFRFCKQNNIPISVNSKPGEGTTFTLKLPVSDT